MKNEQSSNEAERGHCIKVEIFTQFFFPFSQLTFLFILSGSVEVLNLMQTISTTFLFMLYTISLIFISLT
jgi:hypothetical protein